MSRFIVLALVAVALATSITSAETIIPGGDVSGLWNVAGSPYLIRGNINVPAHETLIIEPKVEVIFQGAFSWTVLGWLEAIGTNMDSILVTAQDTSILWGGIKFDNAPDSSYLEYCVIEYSRHEPYYGGGVSCYFCNPVISHCTLRYNLGYFGGAIICEGSNARITYNDILHNGRAGCTINSGGIAVVYSSDPFIGFNNIGDNYADTKGGAIGIDNGCYPQIVGNYFIGNTAAEGGGVSTLDSYSRQIKVGMNVFADNQVTIQGGGICGGDMDVYKNTLFHNLDFGPGGSGGGISVFTGIYVTNTILWRNVRTQFGGSGPEWFSVRYSDVQNGWPGIGNIASDPLFVAPQYYDFRLQWDSPCIDAGDPNPANNDPDGTRGDIGPFYYDQSVPVRVLLTPHERSIVIPAQGGSFDYTLWLSNIDPANPSFTVWTNVILPSGTIIGPIVGPVTAQLDSGMTINRVRTQSVPAGAPRGLYTYNSYAVAGGDTSRDSFSFFNIGSGVRSIRTPMEGLGASEWTNTGEEFDGGTRSVASLGGSELDMTEHVPPGFSPNPFNAVTVISYELRAASSVNLSVYDVAGRKVAELADGRRNPGEYQVTFDASGLASGVYLVRLEAGNFTTIKKLILMK